MYDFMFLQAVHSLILSGKSEHCCQYSSNYDAIQYRQRYRKARENLDRKDLEELRANIKLLKKTKD